MKIESRMLKNAELRAKAGSTIAGYAAVFNSPSEPLPWIETIAPGCFARAISEKQDVRCLFNHDACHILGRVQAGTCFLREDLTGLFFECETPDTEAGRAVWTAVKRGDISECSFSFPIDSVSDRWTNKGMERELLDVDLCDVGPCTFPAYESTSVQARTGQHSDRTTGIYTFTRSRESHLYVSQELADEKRLLSAQILAESIKLK